jgi:hypothetical protein
MAKVLRLHSGNNTLIDWQVSSKYGTDVINQIKDPDGATPRKEITSIPSPFARVDLVKTAFKTITDMKILEGETIFHKMVSDSLDVGEIFFSSNKLRDKVQVLVWDKTSALKILKESPVQAHKSLYETLNMYLAEDAKGNDPYNFSKLHRIYLLNYIGPNKPAQINIIGATSPCTLFFSSANSLNFVSENIQFGQDKPFDNKYQPLYKRDFEFQKYLYTFRVKYGKQEFSVRFPEVNEYLNQNYVFLTDTQKSIIDAITVSDIEKYDVLSVSSDTVEILGHNLHVYPTNVPIKSDFEIKSSVHNDIKPLVLPIESGNTFANLQYTTSKWGNSAKAPFYDSSNWKERTLPFVGEKYPFLTISDFLEDTIIRVPYEINKISYFNGNLKGANGKSYLLPLKDLFFEFFSLEDVKTMIELESNAGGVRITLRIPIKGKRYIEYKRNYFEDNNPEVDATHNDGAIQEDDFVFALYPNIRFTNNNDAFYRFGLISDFQNSKKYDVYFYSKGLIESKLVVRNENNNNYKLCKNFVIEGSNFEYIRIKCAENSGIVIPNFNKQGGTDVFTFAIDLGTTNTHIEYRVGETGIATPLNIGEDKQIHSSSDIVSNNYIFDFDFLPIRIGEKDEFKFPIRTALSEAKNTNWDTAYPMAQANVPFPYEKRDEYKYNRITTGLKWSNDSDNMKRIRCYVDSLFLILRNKVILNNGDLKESKIVWFWPISMTRSRFNLFRQAWEQSYQKYFGNYSQNIIPVTESVAPYEFYRRQVGNANNMVSIDIGGGTSDIVIADSNGIKFITSFRFAANAIFGDGYADNCINGLIRQFKGKILNTLRNAGLDDLLHIYETLNGRNVSSDIASFFFSLKENKEIMEKNLSDSLDFSKILQSDESQKIIFLFFYTAIIYHLAKLMKSKDLPVPRHITFSGNGSKVVQILTPDNKLLEQYTKLIFEKIYRKKYDNDGLTILQNTSNPKEATCKGGIYAPIAQDYGEISSTKVVFKNINSDAFVNNETYRVTHVEDYPDAIVQEAEEFIHFVFGLNSEFSFIRNFGINSQSIQVAQDHCFKDLKTYAIKGISQKLKEVSPDDPIEETFFFYPLIGMLTALSEAIYSQSLNQNQ